MPPQQRSRKAQRCIAQPCNAPVKEDNGGCGQAAGGRLARARLRGKQKLYDFVARRFARRIMPGRLWYRDRALKVEIAATVNQRFQNDALFATLYPKAITGKWVEAGQKGRKNWLLIEHARQSLR